MIKAYTLRLTEEQERKVEVKAQNLGFNTKSDYIRFMILMEISFIEKIDKIYNKVCGENAGKN